MQPDPKPANAEPRWYLAVVCAFKDEAPYLDEWLAFCAGEGVDHVLLYDNASSDDSREVLRPWIESGFVELVDWPLHWKSGAQIKAFIDALHRLRGQTKWAAFIDVDEFLFSPTGKSLPEILREYEGRAGVIVNWQCYGSSGHGTRPPGLTIEAYTRRARCGWARNRRVKTIVDPSLAIAPQSAHLFKVQRGHSLVTEDFRPIRIVRSTSWPRALRRLAALFPYLPFDPYSKTNPSISQVSVSRLRINHYVTRSGEEMPLKYKDRNTMRERDRRSHALYHDRNEVEDAILVPKAARVRQLINKMRGLPNSG